MTKKAKAKIGLTTQSVIEGESDEHEFLLKAKTRLWAPDIDGEILINDTNDKQIEFGKSYNIEITDAKKSILIAKVL